MTKRNDNPTIAAIKSVKHAISKDESRYNLTGVRFEKYGQGTAVVATDGHRLSWRLIPEEPVGEDCGVVQGSVAAKARTPADLPDGRMDVRYPDWMQVVPEVKYEWRLTVNRKRLIQAVKIAKDLQACDNKARAVTEARQAYPAKPKGVSSTDGICLSINHDSIHVETRCLILDDASLQVLSTGTERTAMGQTVGINPKYLLDALNAIDATDVNIQVTGELAPIRIDAGPEQVEVIMPMRL